MIVNIEQIPVAIDNNLGMAAAAESAMQVPHITTKP